eukprot:268753_1
MAELTDDQRMCQMAIELVSKGVLVKFPDYPTFGSTFAALCKEEAYEELDALVEDVSEGFAESVILEQIAEKIKIVDGDKEPLCLFIHHTLSHFKPPPSSLHLAKISIKLTKTDLETMRVLVESQAILLKPRNAKDETLLKLLIMGQKHYFPLLTYLVDLYGRYRLLEYQKLYEDLGKIDSHKKRQKFVSKKFDKVMLIPVFFKECFAMQVLQKKKEKYHDASSEQALSWYEASMYSFFRRLYSPLKMVPNQMVYKINDSMFDYAKYYITLLVTVNNLFKTSDTKLPLQIDFWVIPRAMKNAYNDDDEDEDDDKSDADATDTICDSDIDSNDDEAHAELNINDLAQRLKNVDNLFQTEITNKDVPRLKRTVSNAIEDVVKGARSKRMVMIVDRRINGKDVVQNKINYSEKKEKDAVEEKAKDQLYAFLPRNSQDIPSPHYLHESLFNLSRTEVLPSAGKKENSNIHVISDLMNMSLLSVQIHEETVVCAYWFINGSGARFYVNDMVNIWPLYFIEKSIDPKGMVEHQDVNPIIDLINSTESSLPLQDANFDTFFQVNTRKSPSEAYAKKLTKKATESPE